MLKIDLGCGGNKQEGFTGVDRFQIPGVDLICDLDGRLPFSDDSVDLLFASHSLEHVHDLMATMREVYRICKHGAQVCIVAPYNEQKLNLANPYHICVFNEHTPRFWTDYPDAFIDPEEYSHPHALHWGLSHSDHSDPGLDIRLVRMEFFYFPEYRNLTVEKQRQYRRERLDVCDQIMYHLIVWKGDNYAPNLTFTDQVVALEPFEPKYVKQRKSLEREELLQTIIKERNQSRAQLIDPQSQSVSIRRVPELERNFDSPENQGTEACNENYQLRLQLVGLFEKNEALTDQLYSTNIVYAKSQIEATVLHEKIFKLREDNITLKENNQELRSQQENLESLKTKMILLKTEIEVTNGLLSWHQSRESSWSSEFSRIKEELTVANQFKNQWEEGKKLAGELYAQVSTYRSSRLARVASFFRRKDRLWESVSSAFYEIKSYTAKHFRRSSRTNLVLGDDLGSMAYREYLIPFKIVSLSKVSLAIRPLLPTLQGEVGIEIVSSEQRVVAQVSLPLSGIQPDAPTDFIISTALVDLGETWLLRVFVRNAEVPVAVYELAKYPMFSRKINYMPFVFFQT